MRPSYFYFFKIKNKLHFFWVGNSNHGEKSLTVGNFNLVKIHLSRMLEWFMSYTTTSNTTLLPFALSCIGLEQTNPIKSKSIQTLSYKLDELDGFKVDLTGHA